MYYSQKNYGKAAEKFAGYISKYSNGKFLENAYYFCGESYLRSGDDQRCILQTKKMLSKYPNGTFYYGGNKNLLQAYYNAGNYAEAQRIAEFLMNNYQAQALADGVQDQLSVLRKINGGTRRDIAEKRTEFENAGGYSTKQGRLIGFELFKLYNDSGMDESAATMARELNNAKDSRDKDELYYMGEINVYLITKYKYKYKITKSLAVNGKNYNVMRVANFNYTVYKKDNNRIKIDAGLSRPYNLVPHFMDQELCYGYDLFTTIEKLLDSIFNNLNLLATPSLLLTIKYEYFVYSKLCPRIYNLKNGLIHEKLFAPLYKTYFELKTKTDVRFYETYFALLHLELSIADRKIGSNRGQEYMRFLINEYFKRDKLWNNEVKTVLLLKGWLTK